MRDTRWVIECRHPDGTLDFKAPQPESVFGLEAIHGITEDRMAQIIFRRFPNEDIHLYGYDIENWPGKIDKRWKARRKTW